jgi:hypothetical protein
MCTQEFSLLLTDFDPAGFPLQAVLRVEPVKAHLPEFAGNYRQLLIFASAGRSLWPQVDKHSRPDPIDHYAETLLQEFLLANNCTRFEILYPSGDDVIDLRALGRIVGWHADSCLGIGIHREYGTWFAYRAVVVADTDLPLTESATARMMCESCTAKPCINACPAGAVSADAPFDLDACGNERLREESPCATKCQARLACPVGQAHQYSEEQITYHYERSLESLRRYQQPV